MKHTKFFTSPKSRRQAKFAYYENAIYCILYALADAKKMSNNTLITHIANTQVVFYTIENYIGAKHTYKYWRAVAHRNHINIKQAIKWYTNWR